MAEKPRPISPEAAPDPARSYGREDPRAEAGLGRLDTNRNATPTDAPDHVDGAVGNAQPPRQINAHELIDQRAGNQPAASAAEADHSMKQEEPLGWDQAPTDIHNPRDQRQPKTAGKGGTP